jgi:hypothetical protein
MLAEGAGFGSVQDVEESRSVADFSERRVKEAGAHGAVGFDDGGCPRGVADRRGEFRESERGAEMSGEAAQLFRGFADETSALTAGDQGFDLIFEGVQVVWRERDVVVDYAQAVRRAVKGFGVSVDGEERNRIDVEQTGGVDGFDEQATVGALDGASGGNRKPWIEGAQSADAGFEEIEGAGYAADLIVNGAGTVERDY